VYVLLIAKGTRFKQRQDVAGVVGSLKQYQPSLDIHREITARGLFGDFPVGGLFPAPHKRLNPR
jgi:hypothetical protein